VKLKALIAVGAVAAGFASYGARSATAIPAPIVTANANERLAVTMAAGDGWTGTERTCLTDLWERESGWSQYADTRVTGLDAPDATVFAYGIAQARSYRKMPRAGWPADEGGDSDPAVQVKWGLGYIRATYGDPCAAWNHEEADGWY
jgi:hypothetical protein